MNAAEYRIRDVLRRSRQSALFGGICSIGWGLAMRVGGAKTINSLLVRSLWPFFVLGGVLSIAWSVRPASTWLAQTSGLVTAIAWFARGIGAIAWGIENGPLWDSRVALVFFSHMFVAELIATSTALRTVPIAKTIEPDPSGGFTITPEVVRGDT